MLKNNPNKRIKGKANTNFPIIRDASTFKGRKIYIESLVGIKALAMLESLQPFNDSRGWEKNALMFLHDQNNVDKHQLLVPAIAVLNAGRFSSETVGGRDVRFVAKASLMEVGDGAEIVQCVATPPEDVVDLNYVASFDLVFKGKPGPVLVVPSLENIIGAVERIGAKFATLL